MDDKSNRTGCLGILLNLFGGGSSRNQAGGISFPYGVVDAFLSPAELSFFLVLKSVLPPGRHLTAKVNLADLFYVKKPNVNQAARNRIDRKHVDFVVCDAGTMRPLLGIELDDASHKRKDREDVDIFKDGVFAAAGLPLLRVPAARNYNPKELSEKIQSLLTP
jgi:hypothetical protein